MEVGHYEAQSRAMYRTVEFFKTITTKKQKNTSNSFLERRWRERGKEKRGALVVWNSFQKKGRRMCEL